jgi:hypothetical protein
MVGADCDFAQTCPETCPGDKLVKTQAQQRHSAADDRPADEST